MPSQLNKLRKSILGLYIAWLVTAVMLVVAATATHPYSFYTLLRWICCTAFVYSAFIAHEENRVAWAWSFGVLAALFNPILPVTLDRSIWTTLDWVTVGAIVIAAFSFLPRMKESTGMVPDKPPELLDVSKQRIAREWLIFLGTLPLGFATCFFGKYFLNLWGSLRSTVGVAFDFFYRDHFGLGHASSLAFLFAPYLGLLLIRSVIWSVSTLQKRPNLKREASYSLVAVYLIGAFWFIALIVQNQSDQRREAEAKQDWFTRNAPKSDTNLVPASDLARILLSNVYQGLSAIHSPQGFGLQVQSATIYRVLLRRCNSKFQFTMPLLDLSKRKLYQACKTLVLNRGFPLLST